MAGAQVQKGLQPNVAKLTLRSQGEGLHPPDSPQVHKDMRAIAKKRRQIAGQSVGQMVHRAGHFGKIGQAMLISHSSISVLGSINR